MKISYVDDSEIFKTCLGLWHSFAQSVYTEKISAPRGVALYASESLVRTYSGVLRALRLLMIQRMAKPLEVLVVTDGKGNLVREVPARTTKTEKLDSWQQHKMMQDTLKYLTYIDYNETHQLMLDKLSKQLDGQEWGWEALSTLCWAIGAIRGCVGVADAENNFLTAVIKNLLALCEKTSGKDNKAVVASNFIYVVGQYRYFLSNHWKFLKTVVYKLLEFMHESHPGVQASLPAQMTPMLRLSPLNSSLVNTQEMACGTFLNIARHCSRSLATVQAGEQTAFIEELLLQKDSTPDHGRLPKFQNAMLDLEPQQRQRFREALALMIQAVPDDAKVPRLIGKLMSPPNAAWDQMLAAPQSNGDLLRDKQVVDKLNDILLSSVAACTSLGAKFHPKTEQVYAGMHELHRAYFELLRHTVAKAVSIATSSAARTPLAPVGPAPAASTSSINDAEIAALRTIISVEEKVSSLEARFLGLCKARALPPSPLVPARPGH